MVTAAIVHHSANGVTCPVSKIDWEVVETARTDGPTSLNPNGILANLARMLFGVSVTRGLPNTKLEALRRSPRPAGIS